MAKATKKAPGPDNQGARAKNKAANNIYLGRSAQDVKRIPTLKQAQDAHFRASCLLIAYIGTYPGQWSLIRDRIDPELAHPATIGLMRDLVTAPADHPNPVEALPQDRMMEAVRYVTDHTDAVPVLAETALTQYRHTAHQAKLALAMEQRDPEAIREVIDAHGTKGRQIDIPRLCLVHASEMPSKPPDFLITPYFESGILACIFGDPGSGKTFMGLDIAGCIAKKLPWHDHKTEGGSVIYIAGEGLGGIGRRRMAWEIRHQAGLIDAPLYFSTGPTSLCDVNMVSQLLQAVDVIGQKDPPKLVVFDTLARNFGPGDENSTKDMSMVIQALDTLRLKYGCTVLLIHHTGHGDKNRARGAMALKGALDAEYKLEKDDQGIVRFSALKMKDAELPPPLAFEIRSVGLGFNDEDGQEINSAILDRVDYEPPNVMHPLGKWQQVAQDKLTELFEKHRSNLQGGGYDPDNARVRIAEWRQACSKAGMPRQRFHEIKRKYRNDGSYIYLSGT